MEKRKKRAVKPWFAPILLRWNREANKRQMPWKGEKDPYRIWLSEIILQQTRVEQGLGYYEKFIRVFPDIHKLARARDEKLFKLWEGLGYYSRCRNLLATARYISKELNGKFPDDYGSIRNLKGVGPYTAAAISSFAFNLPYPVVDGNVFRVLSRVFGIDTAIDSVEGKKRFTALAGELLDKKEPGPYNQAIMDFGATVCKPVAPHCGECVFNKYCFAFLKERVHELPVKEKKILIRKRWFYYLVLEYKNETVIQKRNGKDIWQGLYEFPLLETNRQLAPGKILQLAERKQGLQKKNYSSVTASPLFRQQLSHQLITGRFLILQLKQKPRPLREWNWIKKQKLNQLAFPGFINKFLHENNRD